MRKIFGFLVLVLAGVLFGGVVFAVGEGKPATAGEKVVITTRAKGETSPAVETDNSVETSEASVDYQEKLIEGKLESFEDRVDGLQWMVTTVLTVMGLMLGILGLFAFKQGREYKEAVVKAGSEADKAEAYAKSARDWEEKAQKKYNDFEKESRGKLTQFDKKAEAKFAELETKAEKQLAKTTEDRKQDIAKESEKQRELSKKWSDAIRASSDGEYEKACQLWEEVVQQDENESTAWSNWGTALIECATLGGAKAEKRFEEACEKYKTAISIQKDFGAAYCGWGTALIGWAKLGGAKAEERLEVACEKLGIAISFGYNLWAVYENWGIALFHMANFKTGDEKERLLKDAEGKLLKVEEIETGRGAYSLACLYNLQGNKDKCRKWLKVGEEAGTFRVTQEYAEKDKDLESVWGEAWFKEIRWKGEK